MIIPTHTTNKQDSVAASLLTKRRTHTTVIYTNGGGKLSEPEKIAIYVGEPLLPVTSCSGKPGISRSLACFYIEVCGLVGLFAITYAICVLCCGITCCGRRRGKARKTEKKKRRCGPWRSRGRKEGSDVPEKSPLPASPSRADGDRDRPARADSNSSSNAAMGTYLERGSTGQESQVRV